MQHRAPADRGRHDVEVRDCDEPERDPERLRGLLTEPPHHRQHPVRVGGVEEEPAAHDRAHGDEPDLERRHHPDVGTPAAQRGEQLVVRADPAQDPVAGDDLDGAQVVGRPAELASEQPQPAAQGVADHPHPREGAGHRREPVQGRRRDEVPRARTGLDPGSAGRRVDAHAAHPPRGHDHPALESGGVPVPRGLDRDREVLGGRPPDGGGDVVGVTGTDDDVGSVRVRGLESGELAGEVRVAAAVDRAADVGQGRLGARHDLIVGRARAEVQDTVATAARSAASAGSRP